MKRPVCALVAVAHLAACSTLTTVPYGPGQGGMSPSRPAAVGDDLRITFREGGEKWIRVTSVNADEICAAEGCIPATQIVGVERSEVDKGRVLLMVLGVLLVLGLAAAMAGGGLGSGGLGGGA